MTSAISKLVGRYWAGRVSGTKVAQQIWPNWPRGRSLLNLPELLSTVRLGKHMDQMGLHGP
jgi:hypothetical protein